jgi:ABC-type lipoprotein release transport system permease subunit
LQYKQAQLKEYESKKGGYMAQKKTEHKFNFTAFGIIGVVAVLALMAVYPKLAGETTQTTTNSKPQVTVENEFSTSTNSPRVITGASPEEKQAAQEYFFTIISPVTHSTVNTKTVTVSGKTVPNADVYVNEIDAKANAQGDFSVNYQLEEGINYLVVGGNDTYGNYQEQELVVTYVE